jgi:hypothetical protein
MAKRNGFGWDKEALRAFRMAPLILPAMMLRCRRLDTKIGETPNLSSRPCGYCQNYGKELI